MPSIVGKSTRVVDVPGLTIDELAGNVASQSDRISIALVKAAAGTSEPWLTLHYTEWICVLKGRVVLKVEGASDLEVPAGSTVMITEGERFKPVFPEDTEYVPVCTPAFRPDRCVREDDTPEGAGISSKLQKLHAGANASSTRAADKCEPLPEVLFHMTTKAQWEAAKASDSAYYPTTYEEDGFYTHATGVPSRLVTTANHFYQDVPGEWVCVSFTRSALRRCGIHVRDERALPVGDKPVGDDWGDWVRVRAARGVARALSFSLPLLGRSARTSSAASRPRSLTRSTPWSAKGRPSRESRGLWRSRQCDWVVGGRSIEPRFQCPINFERLLVRRSPVRGAARAGPGLL